MKIVLLTVADENYTQKRELLVKQAEKLGCFDQIISKTINDIDSDFYIENRVILNETRGAGYWCWKPYFILQELEKLNEGDVLMYLDAGDWIIKSPCEFLLEAMKDKDMILTDGAYKNSIYTKKDCFHIMGCDHYVFHDAIQLEAGILVFKKTVKTMEILKTWLHFCCIPECVTDMENKFGENYAGFKDHRHDQSILSNLKIASGLYSSSEMREFIICNYEHKD